MNPNPACLAFLTPFALCAQPSQRPFTFEDAGHRSGLQQEVSGIKGHGASWGDANGDGWADLYIPTFHYKGTKPNRLLLNKGGQFTLDDQAAPQISTRGTGTFFADLDNDGDLDLYVASMPAPDGSRLAERQGHPLAGCSLFRNDGNGKFTNISQGNGACPDAFGGRSACVLDFDGDGLLDILVGEEPLKGYNGSETTSSRLFRNLGKLEFEDVTQEAGIPSGIPGLGVAAADMNLDTWPDILLVSTVGNHLFLNDGKGKFSESKGSPDLFKWEGSGGENMVAGVCVGDINNDGLPDIAMGQHYSTPWVEPVPNRLYMNTGIQEGRPGFVDATEQCGLPAIHMKSPHLEIQDFDNDGLPDLYVSIVKFDMEGKPHPLIFRNLGNQKKSSNPTFLADALSVNDFPTPEDKAIRSSGKFFNKMIEDRKVAYFAPGPVCDFDKDGKLDMALPSWWPEMDTLLLKNTTETGNYIQIRLDGRDGVNSMGVGARVEVFQARRANNPKARLGSREVAVGFGYASGQEAIAHFGLGKLESCDIVVTLPHGQGRIIRTDVRANQRLALSSEKALRAENEPKRNWPPDLPGVTNGYASLTSPLFLEIPPAVAAARENPEPAPFVMAKSPPLVELAFHGNLGANAASRRLWSSWGDICVASDGSVYSGIGDHGDDAGGDARCFLYRWEPKAKKLVQVVDMGKVVPQRDGQPAWSKVHAKIDEGPDKAIYFSCTLNGGQRAGDPKYKWNESLPGGQLYRFDPESRKTTVFANLPLKRCTATSLVNGNLWWANLEAGHGDALFALDLRTKKTVHQTSDGTVGFNRAIALGKDGSIYFNHADAGLHRFDPSSGVAAATGIHFPEGTPGIRSASRMGKDGYFHGSTYKTNQLYSIHPGKKELLLHGPTWLEGEYTTVMELSPDERFLYYLPGAHGKAWVYGTPVIQFDLKKKVRKVLAFLAPVLEETYGYVPGGTYGIKTSPDGSTLYVNFNGHLADSYRPSGQRPIGFGLCAFAAIHIPETER